MHYGLTDTHYYRFSTELARDEWVSRSPHSRAACDPPADTSGFRNAGSETEWKERDTPVSQSPLTDRHANRVNSIIGTVVPVEVCQKFEKALNCALNLLGQYEPEDSRAVSDIFVALATVVAGNDDADSWALIDAVLKADLKPHEPCACCRVTVVDSETLEPVSSDWKSMDVAPQDGSPIVVKRGITIQKAWWHSGREAWIAYRSQCSCGTEFFHRVIGPEGWMTYDEAVAFLK